MRKLTRRTILTFSSLTIGLAIASVTWAQMDIGESRLIPYEGHLDLNGVPVTGTYDFRFALFANDGADASCLVAADPGACGFWWEQHLEAEGEGVEVNGGAFGVVLGETQALNDAVFAQADLYLAMAVKATSDPAFTLLSGKQRILAVPFAARAAAAKNYEITGQAYLSGSYDTQTQMDGTVSDGNLVIGDRGGSNITIDADEIAARNASYPGDLYIQEIAGAGNTYLNRYSGSVSIGATAAPAAKLHVQGDARITDGLLVNSIGVNGLLAGSLQTTGAGSFGALVVGGHTIGRITVCHRDATPARNGNWNYLYWMPGTCDNGEPSGNCFGAMTRAKADYGDEDWRLAMPGESMAGIYFPFGGMIFWCSNLDPGCPNADITAIYFCEQ